VRRKVVDEWAKVLGGSLPTPSVGQRRALIRVIEWPAVRALEDAILLHRQTPGMLEPYVTLASQKLFGITEEDTFFDLPDAYWAYEEDSPEKEHLDDLEMEHEEQFETDELTDDETCALLAGLGLDFTDDRGNPLRCTQRLSRCAEAAAKAICGNMPDREVVALEKWGDSFARDAKAFIAKKKGNRG
jgi:hypothetical protein